MENDMKFLTKEEIVEASKDEMSALKCSLLHHQQGRDASSLELQNATDSNIFMSGTVFCACCRAYHHNNCKGCPLGYRDSCCGETFKASDNAIEDFYDDPSNTNHEAFTDAESKVCDYIQGVIDKKLAALAEEKKLELRHGDYGYLLLDKKEVDPKLFIRQEHNINAIKPNGGCSNSDANRGVADYSISGNIFDDLKAMQEDVAIEEKFNINCAYVPKDTLTYFFNDQGVWIQFNKGRQVKLSADSLSDFILKLRQMQATLKRQEAKK
jgi:hypothetical protein